MKKGVFLIFLVLLFSGCNFNLKQNAARSISCDDPDAISLAQNIINNNLFNDEIEKNATSKFKIDKSNIVWWDTKQVGRNLCKAKISAKVYKPGDFDNFFINLINGYLSYGIHYNKKKQELSGWIYYQTYPVMDSKDNYFYVEILPQKEVKDW